MPKKAQIKINQHKRKNRKFNNNKRLHTTPLETTRQKSARIMKTIQSTNLN